MSIEAVIERIEKGIRLLKVQYDQYFAGVLNLPPYELRSEIEALIRKYSFEAFPRPVDRFHFNSLVSRFNTYSELWAKCVRLKEEGRAMPGFPAAPVRSAAPAPPADGNGNGSRGAGNGNGNRGMQAVVGGAHWDAGSLRPLYDQYVKALKTGKASGGSISFDSFARQIARKAEAVKARASCDAVQLRLTLDGGKMVLKARPVRRRKKTP